MKGLAFLFFATALIYAMVGFGGGSTYTALLVLWGVPFAILPLISLSCNIVVVTGGVWRFRAAQALPAKKLVWLLAGSVPAAWIGGQLPIGEFAFVLVLAVVLAIASGLMLVRPVSTVESETPWRRGTSMGVGAGLGAVAGVVGIGGGIILAPLLHLTGWDTPRRISGACSLFILVNSVSGLAGQIVKRGGGLAVADLLPYWPVLAAALIGGQIGSWIGSERLPSRPVRILTALVVLAASLRLFASALSGIS
ncbi:MAG: sulfite exporter TauE/SafE family protein [Pseudomonadota bacterium]